MGKEEVPGKRQEAYIKDRKDQAAWYESLNLYAEALKIYRSIEDEENINRLERKMMKEYIQEARKMERKGRIQQAANLYYLVGDHDSVGRLKQMKPELVIFYDEDGGGLARMAGDIGSGDDIFEGGEDLFQYQNKDDFELSLDNEGNVIDTVAEDPPSDDEKKIVRGRKGVPVKMPKGHRKMRFCPYCGERISTRKEPKFCPFCGDELV